MNDDNIKATSVITCSSCGCLVAASYWDNHVEACDAMNSAKKALIEKARDKVAKDQDYWR